MNKMTIKKSKWKRCLSTVIAVVLLFTYLSIISPDDFFIPFKVFAANVTINSYQGLIDYATNYSSSNSNDVITIAISTDGENVPMTNYAGIGISSAPFSGEIIIESGNYKRFNLDAPLFNYISTSAKITINGDPNYIILTASDTTNRPLFAQHIVNGGNNVTADWKIALGNHDDQDGAYANGYGGLIGDIADGCKIDLEVTNNMSTINNQGVDDNPDIDTTGSTETDKNAGLLCGTLGENAVLNATINSGTATTYSITSPANAGGLVGEMKSNSQLILSGSGLNSITQTVNGDYAGGIVGYAVDAYIGTAAVTDSDYSTITVNDAFRTAGTTVSGVGTKGSGYLFGYYENSANDTVSPFKASRTFNIEWTSLQTVSLSNGNSGGLFGVLKNTNTSGSTIAIDGGQTIDSSTAATIGTATSSNRTIIANVSDVKTVYNKGGLIGIYHTSNIKNTLNIEKCAVKISNVGDLDSGGGIIGRICKDDGCDDAYVKLSNIYTETTDNTNGGGLVGAAGEGNRGAFIDVSGYIKVKGKFSAGLVKNLSKGVLRIEGITDLSNLTGGNFIVGTRDSALIYSRGSGNDVGTSQNEWRLIRHPHASNDVSTWGEVLRLKKSTLNGAQIIDETYTYDKTNANYHTVTLKPAPSGTISTLTDFALLALNIQFNTSSTCGVLKVSGSNSDALLASDLELAANTTFNLSETGITGLTRDCSGDNYQSKQFTKSISGGANTKITLAIGEPYGVNSSGTAVTANSTGSGMIYGRAYNGLLARTNGAEISDITIDGIQYICASGATYFGAVSALSSGGDTISGVASDVTLYASRSGDSKIIAGGMIGITATSASGGIEFTDCATTAKFHDNTQNADDKPESYFGGYIGLVDASGGAKASTNNALTVSFGTTGGSDTCSVGGSYTSEYSTAALNSIYGGLIGAVRGNNTHSMAYRTINAYSVTVDGLSISSKSNTASGGLLGYAWHDAEVNLQNVTVGENASNTVTIAGGTAKKLAGLVYNATGHWTVGNVSIANTTFTANNTSSSLGLLVNSTVNECRLNIDNDTSNGYARDKTAGLYLEILNKTNYRVDDTSALSIDSKVTVFDEIAAFSKHPDKNDISDNGHSIISINTNGSGADITMTGTSCNTYQNQSAYGKDTITVNPNTRYYYNLDTIRGKTSPTAAEKLLLWSLDQYALNKAIKDFFDGTKSGASVSEISGNLDMEGLSYYPVDATQSIGTVSKLKFYNKEIETAEGLTGNGNTDGVTRSTTSTSAKSQHYMMHCGLFRNVSGGISNSNISVGNITLEGNVGIIDSGSGFLVCGTLGGGTGVTTFGNGSSNTITLNDAYVNGADTSNFAPLLIANVDSNAVLNINGVKSQNYSSVQSMNGSWYAATSLIGKAGKTDGSSKNMKVNFSKITLDSRVNNITDADNSRLSTVYGSTKTIFKNAILLEHYYFDTSTDTDSEGVYNYTHDEDWGTDTIGEDSVVKHQVTYGQEVSGSQEYDGKQEKYYGSSYYTDPTSGSNSTSEYSFASSSFLPYVGKYNDADTNYHELKVNHSVVSLTNGCGTYNDPYIVDGGMLGTVSSILNGNNPDSTIEICLPDSGLVTKTSSEVTTGVGDINLFWCTGSDYHHSYHWNGSAYSNSDGSKTYSKEIVQAYLAGAYYEINKDIEVEAGLSGSSKYTVFRGVIVGKKFTDDDNVERYPNVTLTSASPFIPTSNGCVVKDLNFTSGANVTLTQNNATDSFEYSSGCQSYGVVIGKIMGGDNVIDNVGVTYSGTITSSTNAHIVPVGCYVGVVVNGGLFFRNMDLVPDAKKVGLTDSNFIGGDHIGDSYTTYLYHNPIIGRVINGYAVTEAASYVPGAASQTMKNGTKNYAITDIDKNACVGGTDASKILDVQSSTIKVPDAQAWFIMSCIVNSGTGSGSGAKLVKDAAGNISYSMNNYKPTHIGTYEDVGCGSYATKAKKLVNDSPVDICDTAVFASTNFELGSNTEYVTPYITYKYTKVQDNQTANHKRLAKSINGTHSITLNHTLDEDEAPAEWTLPDGYRGIGGLNAANSSYNITVSGMTCNSTIINLNMKYQTYLYSFTNKIYQENYYPGDYGFGLFNTFKPSTALTVSDLTLKGNVYVDTLDKDTGEPKLEYGTINDWKAWNKSSDDIRNNTNGRVSVGMFAGQKDKTNNNLLTLSNVALNSINVHSSRCAGGLFGIAAYVTIQSCPATNISVLGRWDTGGYIGQFPKVNSGNGTLNIIGATDNTVVNINTVNLDGLGHNADAAKRPGGVGGLVGRIEQGIVTISNVSLTKYSGYGYVEKTPQGVDETGAGGLVGLSVGTLTVSNCNLTGITVKALGGNIGGIGGAIPGGTVTISNITLDGSNSEEGIYLTDRANIGGIFGRTNCNITISQTQLKNYSLQKTMFSNTFSSKDSTDHRNMGCVIGRTDGGTIKIKDLLVSNCSIAFPEDGNIGGIIGWFRNGELQGYNIAEQNITLSNTTAPSWYKGDLFGTNVTAKRPVKVVGYSRQTTPTNSIHSGTVSDDSYVIFSDYSGTGFDGTGNTGKPYVDGTEASMVATAVPYATVNPSLTLFDVTGHKTFLTGDGMAASKNANAIKSIVDDLTANTSPKRYLNASAAYKIFTGSDVGNRPKASSSYSSLSTFNTEWGAGTVAQDFVVLNLEESNPNKATPIINNYINLLANTNYNYAAGDNSKYTVNIYKMQLANDGTYDYFTATRSDTTKAIALQEANLKLSGGKFSMLNDSPDTTESSPTFSLIDIAFKDPTNSSSTIPVYHLYIPIYVKKMMKYNFRIASGTGSNYERAWYSRNNRWGKIALENYGSPITMYFEYEYERTLGEWRNAVSYGDTLLANYDKKLSVTRSGAALDDDTILVLIDRNDKNKPYYARASQAFTGSYPNIKLDLEKFKSVLDDANSDSFKPVTIQSMLEKSGYTVSAARDDTNGTYQLLTDTNEADAIVADATVRGNLEGTVRYFKPITGDEDPQITEKYTLSIASEATETTDVNLTESYYITVFSKVPNSGTEIYHDTIGHDPLGSDPTPSKLDTAVISDDQAHIVFGEVVTQTTYISQPDVNDPVVKLSENDTVKAKLETTLTVPDNRIRGFMNDSSVKVYQSFLVYMTKHDTDGSTAKEIIGKPITSGSFTVKDGNGNILMSPEDENGDPIYDGETQVTSFTFTSTSMTDTGNYVEFATQKDIKAYLLNEGSSVKIEANVNLQYNGDAKINGQFPPRVDPETETDIYTVISGASHIAYDPTKTAYSKTAQDALLLSGADPLLHYYTRTSKSARLDYNAYADENGVYGQLGINARTDEKEVENGTAEVKTLAVYDVSEIIQNVPATTYDMVRCTFEVEQKQNGGTYSEPLIISNFMSDVYLDGFKRSDEIEAGETADYTRTQGTTKYTFEIARTKLADAGDSSASVMSIPITFDVYSGAGSFETNGRMYSNYKVIITVELYDNDAPNKPTQTMNKYIIYTNAKLISDFIE